MHFRSVADLNRCVARKAATISQQFDLIVGIPRSGMLAGSLIALHSNLPLCDIESYLRGADGAVGFSRSAFVRTSSATTRRRVLVVDDSICTGQEIGTARTRLSLCSARKDDVRFGAVYAAPGKESEVDLYWEVCHFPRCFEWNLMHGATISQSCVDIDGVLCVDPTEKENDDGEQYRHFLLNAPAYLIPSAPVGWLVTSRLEKYRGLTEEWLKRNNVRYRQLHMLDLPDKKTRVRLGLHGAFKADIYRKSGMRLFVESSPKQARQIADLTHKPVLCVETSTLVSPSIVTRGKRWTELAPKRIKTHIHQLRNSLRQLFP